MKEKVIKIIVTIIIIIIIIIGLLSLGNVEIENGKIKTKKNNTTIKNITDDSILKNQKLKNLDITDVSISYVEGTGTTFKFTITNNTGEVVSLKSIDVLFKDKDGNTITILSASLGGEVNANQKNIIRLTHPDDLTKAVSIEYQEGN